KPFWLYVHGTGAETENAISWLKKLTGLKRWNTMVVASGVSITPGAESPGRWSARRAPTSYRRNAALPSRFSLMTRSIDRLTTVELNAVLSENVTPLLKWNVSVRPSAETPPYSGVGT